MLRICICLTKLHLDKQNIICIFKWVALLFWLMYLRAAHLLGRIAYEKLMKLIISKDILYKHQYGLSPKHSTIYPIIHLLNYCATLISKLDPEFRLYYSKNVPWDSTWLVWKVSIWSTTICWGSRNVSARVSIITGVPRGSILGPLLYPCQWHRQFGHGKYCICCGRYNIVYVKFKS